MPHVPTMLRADRSVFEECHLFEDNACKLSYAMDSSYGQVVSEKNMLEYIDGSPICVTMAKRSKLDCWCLFVVIVLLGQTYLTSIERLWLQQSSKNLLFKIFPK